MKETKKANIFNFENPEEKKGINKKKISVVIAIALFLLTIIIIYLIYSFNEPFRNWWDVKILRKNINEENLAYIELDNVSENNILAYSNQIAFLKDNNLSIYNSNANKIANINMQITTPIIATNGEYAVIAEKEGQRIYLISRSEVLWEKELEGNISRVNVNNNGYVSVIVSGTSYKSVITLFDYEGKEQFKTYLGATIAVDSDISPDNKYMSFAEVNISGALVKATVKIISVEKAKENKEDYIVYKYEAPSDSLILNIKYQGKKLICMYDDSIHIIESEEDRQFLELLSKNISFADINLNNNILICKESNDALLSTKTEVKILNSATEKENIYNISGSIKGIYVYEDKIGINLGLGVHFINTTGWLIKKYSSSQEIKAIVMSNNIAGVVYKKKIEIVKF